MDWKNADSTHETIRRIQAADVDQGRWRRQGRWRWREHWRTGPSWILTVAWLIFGFFVWQFICLLSFQHGQRLCFPPRSCKETFLVTGHRKFGLEIPQTFPQCVILPHVEIHATQRLPHEIVSCRWEAVSSDLVPKKRSHARRRMQTSCDLQTKRIDLTRDLPSRPTVSFLQTAMFTCPFSIKSCFGPAKMTTSHSCGDIKARATVGADHAHCRSLISGPTFQTARRNHESSVKKTSWSIFKIYLTR